VRAFGPGALVAPDAHVVAHLHRSEDLDVYDAWCERRTCRVIVKTPRPDRRGDRRIVRALLAEGRLLCRLSHPAIVRGYEVHDGPRPSIVMETLGGETLDHLVRRREHRRLAAAEIAVVALQLGGALRYLHAAGVLHLDVKLANVIADAGRAKLVDLSIARRPGRVVRGLGTPSNMAPEQARGGDVASAADVWGLGTILYELATGANPFADDDTAELPQLERRAAAVGARRRLPAALAAAIDGCLEPDPASRTTLGELLGTAAAAAGGAPAAGR
jgi:serine/threonine protein kinase